MEADSQVRPVLDRMAIDFAQMIRRPDLDCYVKSGNQPGNDQIAFFSNVAGYYPPTGSQSPISLIAYRINSDATSASFNRMERMGKGLLWAGVSTTDKPILFGLDAIVNNWPAATDGGVDPDYELVGPQLFRFEYFYLLNTGAISDLPGVPGMQNVAAIVATVAAIDQKSRVLLTNAQVSTLGGRLKDFDATKPIHDLTTSWQATLDGITDIPRETINGVRIYQRYFYVTAAK